MIFSQHNSPSQHHRGIIPPSLSRGGRILWLCRVLTWVWTGSGTAKDSICQPYSQIWERLRLAIRFTTLTIHSRESIAQKGSSGVGPGHRIAFSPPCTFYRWFRSTVKSLSITSFCKCYNVWRIASLSLVIAASTDDNATLCHVFATSSHGVATHDFANVTIPDSW